MVSATSRERPSSQDTCGPASEGGDRDRQKADPETVLVAKREDGGGARERPCMLTPPAASRSSRGHGRTSPGLVSLSAKQE